MVNLAVMSDNRPASYTENCISVGFRSQNSPLTPNSTEEMDLLPEESYRHKSLELQ